MSKIKNIQPDAKSEEHSNVLILPSDFFFKESVEIPPDVTKSELANFAELNIESIAPFTLEQLKWGFIKKADCTRVLIYAAFSECLVKAGFTDLEDYNWVLPDFESFKYSEFTQETKSIYQDENSLWQADVRPKSFKKIERNKRRITSWVTMITGYAAIFTLILVLMETLLLVSQSWLNIQQANAVAQKPEVSLIENKYNLMEKLEQVAQNELRPIEILDAANQIRISLGSRGIEYDEVIIEGSNRLAIEGKANSINELNEYTQALSNSGNFQLVESPKSITRSGKTTFTATLDYLSATKNNSK